MNIKYHLVAMACATTLAGGWASAQSTAATPTPTAASPALADSSQSADLRRERLSAMKGDKEALQQRLSAGQPRGDYAKIIESNGFRISAINADKPDYLEYEVVKGKHSYEVQIDFAKGAANATKVDVASNMWRADATKRMMKEADYRPAGPLKADAQARHSDSRYMKSWNNEKERLEKALPLNQKAESYKSRIEQLGYQVTAVNDRAKDHVEYEIAKGDNSYEVQIVIDPNTGTATQIDVTANLWEAEATDRATSKASK